MRAGCVIPNNGGLESDQSLAHSDEGIQTVDGEGSGYACTFSAPLYPHRVFFLSISGEIRPPAQRSL